MAWRKTICCLDQEYMHVFIISDKLEAKFHKEMPFLHKNELLHGIVQVSEWNFDPTSLQMQLIVTMCSESALVNLKVTGEHG